MVESKPVTGPYLPSGPVAAALEICIPLMKKMTKEAVRAEADISILCAEVSGYEDC